MSPMTLAAGLLGQLDQLEKLRAVRDALNKDAAWSQAELYMVLMGAAAVCGLVVLFIRIRRRRAAGGGVDRKRGDYLAWTVRRLGLGRAELRDLRAVTARAKLTYPASVLLSPGNLAHAARIAQQGGRDPALEQRLSVLCEKVFGTRLPEWPPPRHNAR